MYYCRPCGWLHSLAVLGYAVRDGWTAETWLETAAPHMSCVRQRCLPLTCCARPSHGAVRLAVRDGVAKRKTCTFLGGFWVGLRLSRRPATRRHAANKYATP